ncbi:hypothetical protein ACTU9R_22300 [Burkholderia gladioli]|uniref:hypothetical protein n=1 Tax=Burkholderia gladioli TaxID=28095 RepID=UPI003FA61255
MGFIVQRFHPLIRPALHLGAARLKIPVYSGQSAWDSLCSLHAFAMALQITGRLADPSGIATRRRRIEASIRHKAAEVFQKGMTFRELADFIAELDFGLRTTLVEHGSHRKTVDFTVGELSRKRLVVVSFRAVGDSLNHAVLVIGAEGVKRGRRFEAQALLVLDPSEPPPGPFATCNARLDFAGWEPGEIPRYARYTTTAHAKFAVVLNGAVSLDAG